MSYFDAIAPIWSAFFAGEISVAKRDRLLEPFRAALRAERLRG